MTYALVIYYLDNDSKASEVSAVGKEYNAADFDHPPCGGVDVDFGHPQQVSSASINFYIHHALEVRD